MTRRQQHLAIWVALGLLLLGLPLVAPPVLVTFVVAAAISVGAVGLVAQQPLARGFRLLAAKQHDEALAAFASFEARVRQQPWRRWLGFLSTGFSTSNPLAMAVTAQGLVHLELRRFAEAEREFARALVEDPGYALAWANRALAAAGRGDAELARRSLDEARSLGFAQAEAVEAQVAARLKNAPA